MKVGEELRIEVILRAQSPRDATVSVQSGSTLYLSASCVHVTGTTMGPLVRLLLDAVERAVWEQYERTRTEGG